MALRTSPEAFRVATDPPSGENTGIAFSHPDGSFLFANISHSAARSGYSFEYASNSLFHSASQSLPRDTASRKVARASSGTWKGSSHDHPRFFLVSKTSSSPSGAPWTSAVSCLLGLPCPICVRITISEGRAFSSCAAEMAAEIASRS